MIPATAVTKNSWPMSISRQGETLARIFCRDEVSVARRGERREGKEQILSKGSVALSAEEGGSFVGAGGAIDEREQHPNQEDRLATAPKMVSRSITVLRTR